MSNAPALATRGLTRRFGPVRAVDGVDLTVRDGDFVAIVGPSGSGKSTLLNVLGLLDRPDGGSYRVSGTDTMSMGERERDRLRSRWFGFVFQSSHALGDEPVAVNAALGLRVQRTPPEQRDARAGEALALLGLSHRLDTRAKLLSGGERQRLAIARAIATRPRVILADEPTGNLDSVNSRIVIDHLRALHAQGATVLLITHDPEIARQADRQVRIEDGRITELAGHRTAASASADMAGTGHGWSAPGAARRHRSPRSSAMLDDLVEAVSSLSTRFLRTVLLMAAFAVGIGGLVGSGRTELAEAIAGLRPRSGTVRLNGQDLPPNQVALRLPARAAGAAARRPARRRYRRCPATRSRSVPAWQGRRVRAAPVSNWKRGRTWTSPFSREHRRT